MQNNNLEILNAKKNLLSLLKERAFKKGDFILSSGRRSNFFIDCKRVILSAIGHELVGLTFLETLKDWMPINAVAAVAVGGCPLASAVSTISRLKQPPGIDAIYIRKERKDHGTGNIIDGTEFLQKKSRVAVLEDVLTTGASLRWAIEKLLEKDFIVPVAIVLVDREEGGKETLEDLNIPIVSMFKKGDFINE